MTWLVKRISDAAGNFMEFEYEHDELENVRTGEYRVSRILYTGHGDGEGVAAPYASIEFEYEERPDPSAGYYAGSRVPLTKRLSRIVAWTAPTSGGSGWQPFSVYSHHYQIEYDESPATGRSRLTRLQVLGGGSPDIPEEWSAPLKFTYRGEAVEFERNSEYPDYLEPVPGVQVAEGQ